MVTKKDLPECPVATVVELIGNKWKLLIIRNLLVGPVRFNELKKGLPGISQKVLTDNLRSLESNGLVARTVYEEVPPKVEYSLTPMGRSLQPLFDRMTDWGNSYKAFLAEQSEEDDTMSHGEIS
jgi:DNA-binding HxlR family transcriptional regulator